MSPPIALFDPDRSAGESLREYLTRMGLEVQLLHDPQQAIALGREATAKLFIVAVGSAMDEAAVCQALKEGADPPAVIALCERAGLEQHLAERARPDEVFVKPIPFARLLHAAERLLGEATAQRGEGDALAFPGLLVELWRAGRSGVLRLAAEGLQTTIYLKQGVPVFAEHGSLGDTLGRMLVDTGRITGEQFAKAVDLITERLVDNEQLRLGEALVELGILTAEEVMEALRDQVQRKIVAFFGREQFHHDFEVGEEHLEAVGDFAKPMERLLMAGIKTQVSPPRLDRFLGPVAGKYPVPQAPVAELAQSFGMTPQEHAFLDGVNGERTVKQLRELSKLDRVHASQLMAVLVLAGAVRLSDNPASKVTEVAAPPAPREPERDPTPPPKESRLRSLVMAAYLRIKGKTDQEVLDIQEGASQEEIEEAYRKRLQQFNEGIDPGAGQEVQQKATDIVNHLTAARDRLLSGQPASAPARPPRNETQAMLQADREFQRGKQLLQLGQWASAGEFFRRAAQLQPKVDEYQMFSEWMSYLAAKEKDKRKTLRERVERFARRVLKQTPEGHAKAFLILGKLAAESKDRKKAEEYLRRAAELDPDDIDIKRELRLLDLRKQRRW